MIHPTAIVEDGANLAPDVKVGPYALVEAGTTIGGGCEIAAHAVVRRGCVLEERVRIDSFTVIGGDPQDLGFDRTLQTGVRIGEGTVVREHVTVHRSTQAGGFTTIGANCLLMATSHIGHDSCVGNRVVLANQIMLAGHVHVGDMTFMGGGAAMHQNGRIGEGAMISGLSRLSRDVPPFSMVAERDRLVGLNLIGIKRRQFAREWVMELKDCFHAVFDLPGSRRDFASARLAQGVQHPPAKTFLEFFLSGKRGFSQPAREESEQA